MFVFAIIFGALALIAVIVAVFVPREGDYGSHPRRVVLFISGGLLLVGGLFTFLSTFYGQDAGQASILRDWTGNISEEAVVTEGLHTKLPWQDAVTFDVRNQRIVYTGGASEGDNSGGEADGAQITVQDASGVTSNIDISVTYSIQPDAVIDIYRQYLNEDGLKTKLIFNDIRSITRSVPGSYSTIELLTDRDGVQEAIREKLEAKWAKSGIIVNDVSLQEIRLPESVKESYAKAQEAAIAVETAQSNLEKAEVDAQQKVANATAEAEANAILAASLTDSVLKQRYLDTLATLAADGNLVVVPEGFGGIVNIGK